MFEIFLIKITKFFKAELEHNLHCFGFFLERQNLDYFPCARGEKCGAIFACRRL